MRNVFILIFLSSVSFADCDIPEVLNTIRPGAEWSLTGPGYAGLNWTDRIQTKPTQQEIVDARTLCISNNTTRIAQKIQARLDVKNTGLTQGQRIQALLLLLDFDR